MQNFVGNGLLVTGDRGFVGRHALKLWPKAVGLSSLTANPDVTNKAQLFECLRQNVPDLVLHLAGISFVPDSVKNPKHTFMVNFMGTLNLLEALAEVGFKGRFLFVSSGDLYGLVPEDALPVTEEQFARPRNPYAVSKLAAEALCYQWSQTGPFEVVMARPFNHIGAGQSPNFALSDFARQIAEIGAGFRQPEVRVGNIDVTRDFTDVRDVLRAYSCLFEHGKNGEIYNICSGVERSLRTLVEQMMALSGVAAILVSESNRVRSTEQVRMRGSYAKLFAHTGWQPEVPQDEMLRNVCAYWAAKVAV